jgi:protocatechuate 3,4-dioxygenase beta subunit
MSTVTRFTHHTRRGVLTILGQAGLLLACGEADEAVSSTAEASAPLPLTPFEPGACLATPAQDEGPFFVEEGLLRSDLIADSLNPNARNGVPMSMRFVVYRYQGGACTPLEGVHVDIWHADTAGLYSDECVQGTLGDTSLRGYQITDANGVVEFQTVFPGWYTGRTIHIHAKLRAYSGSTTLLDFTTQLYIADELSDLVVNQGAYNTRGARATRNSNDALFTSVSLSGGMPIRLPADICGTVMAGGAFTPNTAPPPGVGGGPPPELSADSMGPRLQLEVKPAADGNGYTSNYVFAIEGV